MNDPHNDAQFFQMVIDTQSGTQASGSVSAQPWQEIPEEGQLAVDVAQNQKHVIIMTTIAGAMANMLDVSVHNDMVTIRGERQPPAEDIEQYFHQECFWGPFSRTIVLPVDVDSHRAKASYHNGV